MAPNQTLKYAPEQMSADKGLEARSSSGKASLNGVCKSGKIFDRRQAMQKVVGSLS